MCLMCLRTNGLRYGCQRSVTIYLAARSSAAQAEMAITLKPDGSIQVDTADALRVAMEVQASRRDQPVDARPRRFVTSSYAAGRGT